MIVTRIMPAGSELLTICLEVRLVRSRWSLRIYTVNRHDPDTSFLEWLVGGRSSSSIRARNRESPIENPLSIYTVHRETEFYRQQSWQVEWVNKIYHCHFRWREMRNWTGNRECCETIQSRRKAWVVCCSKILFSSPEETSPVLLSLLNNGGKVFF